MLKHFQKSFLFKCFQEVFGFKNCLSLCIHYYTHNGFKEIGHKVRKVKRQFRRARLSRYLGVYILL